MGTIFLHVANPLVIGEIMGSNPRVIIKEVKVLLILESMFEFKYS